MHGNSPCKVSVIVPVYKVEKWLSRCIDSLLSQTLHDIEIILVDDGSPDGSAQICDAYAQRDSRVHVIHKDNGGVLLARQTGLEAAAAPYVGFVDGDDFAAPDMFETLWREADKRRADVVCCALVHYWNEEKKHVDPREAGMNGFYAGEQLKDFYQRFFFDNTPRTDKAAITPSLCNKLFKRELIQACHRQLASDSGRIKVGEDMLISYSCLLKASRISVLGSYAPLYYVYRQDSVMRSFKKDYLRNTEILLEQLSSMDIPAEAEQPVRESIARFISYTAVYVVLGIVPADAPFIQKCRKTKEVVGHIMHSPLWQKVLRSSGDDLFEYGFEKLIYKLMLKKMGGSIALLDVVHEHMKAGKKSQ